MLRRKIGRIIYKAQLKLEKSLKESKTTKKKQGQQQKTVTHIIVINITTSIITLNISGLNSPAKRQRL